MSHDTVVNVAVAVIERGRKILVSRRPDHVHQGGLWEFPGGKVESDETIEQALAREIKEELVLEVQACEALLEIHHDYGDKRVCLWVRRVLDFSGEAQGAEQQEVRWVALDALDQYDFPAANAPIIPAIRKALDAGIS